MQSKCIACVTKLAIEAVSPGFVLVAPDNMNSAFTILIAARTFMVTIHCVLALAILFCHCSLPERLLHDFPPVESLPVDD